MPRATTRRTARSPKSWLPRTQQSASGTPPVSVKRESVDAVVFLRKSSKLTINVPPRPPPVLADKDQPWKHPDELEYIRPHSWSEDRIIAFLCTNGFSVPSRPGHANEPWVIVTGQDGQTTIIPRGYRLPLMFASKFQWESLRLVMTSASRDDEWEDYKYDILHVSRLCKRFLEEARSAMALSGMDKMWRCPTFDRALARYYQRWLVNREEFVKDFWIEFEEEEYERDVLRNDWARFVLKGHKGFRLTKDEVKNGLRYEALTYGLDFLNGRLHWITPETSLHFPPKPIPPPLPPTEFVPLTTAKISSDKPTSPSPPSPTTPSPIVSLPEPSFVPIDVDPQPITRCFKDSDTSGSTGSTNPTTPEVIPETKEPTAEPEPIPPTTSPVFDTASSTPPSLPPAISLQLKREKIGEAPVQAELTLPRNDDISIPAESRADAVAVDSMPATIPINPPPEPIAQPWPSPPSSPPSHPGENNERGQDGESCSVSHFSYGHEKEDEVDIWNDPPEIAFTTDFWRARTPLGTQNEGRQGDVRPSPPRGDVDMEEGDESSEVPSSRESSAPSSSASLARFQDTTNISDNDNNDYGSTGYTDVPLASPPPPPTITDVGIEDIDAGADVVPSGDPNASRQSSRAPSENASVSDLRRSVTSESRFNSQDASASATPRLAHQANSARHSPQHTEQEKLEMRRAGSLSGEGKEKDDDDDRDMDTDTDDRSIFRPSWVRAKSQPGRSYNGEGNDASRGASTSRDNRSSSPAARSLPGSSFTPTSSPEEKHFMLSAAAWTSEPESIDADSLYSDSAGMAKAVPLQPPPLPLPVPLRADSSSVSCHPSSFSRTQSPAGISAVMPRYGRTALGNYNGAGDENGDGDGDGGVDRNPVVSTIVSVFRDTLEGLTDILTAVGSGKEDGVYSPPLSSSISRRRSLMPLPPPPPQEGPRSLTPTASMSTTAPPPPPEASLIGELLLEMRSLQRTMQEEADRRAARDLEVQRLQTEMDDLRRQVLRMDRERRMSSGSGIIEQHLSSPPSPSTPSTSSSALRRHTSSSVVLQAQMQSPHPLSHLLAMDVDMETSLAVNGLPLSRDSTFVSSPSAEWETHGPIGELQYPSVRTPAPARVAPPHTAPPLDMAPIPPLDVPLPIKSQRKQRMMFMTHPLSQVDQM